jgi:hypothetical protein
LKHNTVLIALSLLNALFFGLHLTGDIVFGIEKGGREILVGVLILAVYVYGAVGLPERLAGYIILLLGGLASAALPSFTRWEGPSASNSLSCRRVLLHLDVAHDRGDGARRIRPVRARDLEPPTAPACFRVRMAHA